MKMLRRLPKLLRFIPGTAQDVRAYFLRLAILAGGIEDNLANMVRMLVGRYADGARRGLRGAVKRSRRPSIPRSACTTRGIPGRIIDRLDRLPPAGKDCTGHGGRAGAALLRAGRQPATTTA